MPPKRVRPAKTTPERHIGEITGYLRLSEDREGKKIGYDVQRRGIQAHATARGQRVTRWYQDRDLTAADLNVERPEYEAMLVDIANSVASPHVAIWRIDRLVRLSREYERCLGVIEDAGGDLTSTEDGFNTATPIGRLIVTILVAIAQMEIATMRVRSKAHHAEKARKGLYKGGGPRPMGFVGAEKDDNGGYLNSGAIGREHHPEEVPLLRDAARRVAWEGCDWTDIITDWANRTPPVTGTTGAPLSVTTLQRVLTGPRAIGKREAPDDDGQVTLVDANWEPIIDEATWRRLRGMIRRVGRTGPQLSYLLSGWLLCGRCGRPLTGSRRRKNNNPEAKRTYRCKSGVADKARGACGRLDVMADAVEAVVVARTLSRIADTPDILARVCSATQKSDLDALLATIHDCDVELDSLAAQRGAREIDDREWKVARAPFKAKRAAAEAEFNRVSGQAKAPMPTSEDWRDLRAWFYGLPSDSARRSLLEVLITRITVAPAPRCGPRFDPRRVNVTFADAQGADHR